MDDEENRSYHQPILGNRGKSKNEGSEVWHFSISVIKKVAACQRTKRKCLIDPKTTIVDDNAKIVNGGTDGKKPFDRNEGTFYKRYGKAFTQLLYLLSDDGILMDNYFTEAPPQTLCQRFTSVEICDRDVPMFTVCQVVKIVQQVPAP